ncbi:porin [Solimonas sp. K1W22B-7]|uniref:OprO/OprP family phosphate-selective porin n=1 Tax=Solimonas sp. K1W22B-7 TaxID=2303331 RepID=UPI000E334DF8|nr:porin [Solimonas sp. K1W22B-7]AXQ28780.1 porin [Solimonas sp. K1W22B-7]
MKKGIKQASLATLAVFASTGIAQAAESVSVDELDQRIKVLERQLELQAEDAATKAKDATTPSASDKGFSLKKGDYELKIKGLVQADLRYYLDDYNFLRRATPTASDRFNDTVLFRRIRPTFEGSLGKLVGFRLTPEFAGDSATIVDAYLDLKFDPAYTLRVGKVKGPVALERLQSGGSTNFIERGFPTELAPNRDLGVQLQGELFSSTVNYTLGYYNGTADGRDTTSTDVDNRKEIGARVFFEPFKNSPGVFQGLGFGVGSSFGPKEQGENNAANANNFLPRYRTPGQNVFFQYNTTRTVGTGATVGNTGIYADGDLVRISPQAYWYYNSLGVIAEYISSEQDLSVGLLPAGATLATTTLSDSAKNEAWQISASWVITGEDASFRGVAKPKNAYTPGGAGWGAFELAARYGVLDIDDDIFTTIPGSTLATPATVANNFVSNPAANASEAKSFGIGLNWYLTSNLKTQLNYTNTSFEGGAGTTTAVQDRKDEKTIFARFQVAF